jgi:hypothetical protein
LREGGNRHRTHVAVSRARQAAEILMNSKESIDAKSI